MEDSKIIELFFARSEQAINELASKYGATCKRIAMNILKNDSDAEECVNDAYLGAWNTIPPQRPDPLLAYIGRIVRNISITRYHANTASKRNSYYDTTLTELEDCLSDPHSPIDDMAFEELSKEINAFLLALDKESRVMFVRRYWFSDEVEVIADTVGRTPHYVSVKLFRIRARLRKYLMKKGRLE